jgi:methionine--tRNA ligase beta chain
MVSPEQQAWVPGHPRRPNRITSPRISIGDIDKLDIRVGIIERVENVPNSDKLVKLTVNFGDHKRSILAGMRKERLDPKAEIEGRQALFVVNLEPRSMAGLSRPVKIPSHRSYRSWSLGHCSYDDAAIASIYRPQLIARFAENDKRFRSTTFA